MDQRYQKVRGYVRHEYVLASGMTKKYFGYAHGKKLIGHMALTALVLASIQTGAVFAYSGETENAGNVGIALYLKSHLDPTDPTPGGSSSGSGSSGGSSSSGSSSGSTSGSGSTTDTPSTDTPTTDTSTAGHYISVKSTKTDSSSNYNNDGAKSDNSMVIGISSDTHTNAINSTIIGNDSHIGKYGSDGTIIGNSSSINGNGSNYMAQHSTIIGESSHILASNSIIVGNSSKINPACTNSIVVGHYSSAESDNSLVLGNHISLSGGVDENNSIAIGHELTVDGRHNVVLATDHQYNGEQKTTHVAGQDNTVIGVGNIVGYDAEMNADKKSWTYTKRNGERDGNVVIGDTNTSHGNSTVILGANSEAQNLDISLGLANKVNVDTSVIPDSYTHGQYGLAVGSHLNVWGDRALAVGAYGKATGSSTIAIGTESIAYNAYAVSMGYQANANAIYSLAIGGLSKATALQSVAIGPGAVATVNDGIALGSLSVADTEKGVAGYDPKTEKASTDTSYVWTSARGAISVGDVSKGYTRQITNVAAGSKDTDAVNLAQLKRAIQDREDERATTITEINNRMSQIENNEATLEPTDEALSLSGKTLSINLQDTSGNTVTGSVDLSNILSSGTDTTLQGSHNALSLNGNTLSLNLKDTAGNEVSGSVDLSGFASAVDTDTTYTMTGTQNQDNTTTIHLKGSDGNENTVTVATRDTRNTVKAGENVTLDTKAQADGSEEYTIHVKADGKIEKGNAKLISGDTVYGETRVASDGKYIKEANTAGENLTALDRQVQSNADAIRQMGNHMTILGNEVHELDTRVNKVGAGAAALAALHPLDFDPEDKWDLAIGFGNYRNESATALGVFYRPNERSIFSMGCTLGDDRNMFNAGFSVKLGHGIGYLGTSKAELVAMVTEQKDDIAQLKEIIEIQNKKIEEMEEQMKKWMEKQ